MTSTPAAPSAAGYYAAEPIAEIRAIAAALAALGFAATPVIDMGGHSVELVVSGLRVDAYPAGDADPDRDGYYDLLVYVDPETVYYGGAPDRVVPVWVGDRAEPAAIAAALGEMLDLLPAEMLPAGATTLDADALREILVAGAHRDAAVATPEIDETLVDAVRVGALIAVRLADGGISVTHAPRSYRARS